MQKKAFQDFYPDDHSHCYGCGRLNALGLQVKSYWDGDETVAHFTPQPHHTAIPGYVYGGLIASLIDCHSTGSAAAAGYRQEGRIRRREGKQRKCHYGGACRRSRPTGATAERIFGDDRRSKPIDGAGWG